MTPPLPISTTIYIMVEDIMNLFHLQTTRILYLYLRHGRRLHGRLRRHLIRPYSLLRRIPAQVRHMSQLVFVSDIDLLHNFIWGEMTHDLVEEALDFGTQDVAEHVDYADMEYIDQVEATSDWTRMREDLANSMWLNRGNVDTSTEDGELIPECICGGGRCGFCVQGKKPNIVAGFFINVQLISNIQVLFCGATSLIVGLTTVVSQISS
ncbi:uncharacterized protein LOC121782047 [Salvia splendens]|uniref:uncharacterized protein LOC121782047 n=1 Tax=Salvia splendens TaxID=180675 RepID=UPI001C261656|nr:uncharacterized protein LOC121782047 [Salvia splendens]